MSHWRRNQFPWSSEEVKALSCPLGDRITMVGPMLVVGPMLAFRQCSKFMPMTSMKLIWKQNGICLYYDIMRLVWKTRDEFLDLHHSTITVVLTAVIAAGLTSGVARTPCSVLHTADMQSPVLYFISDSQLHWLQHWKGDKIRPCYKPVRLVTDTSLPPLPRG